MIRDDERGRIVFGCGNFGGVGSAPGLVGKGDPPERAFKLLDHARDLGLTRFDTANTYGGGESEIVLGQWLQDQSTDFLQRAEIATKVGNPNGCPAGDRPLSRQQVALHLDRSLARLGLERIGLYYLHQFDRATPLAETFEALGRAREAGKIAKIGICNAALADLDAVLAVCDDALRPHLSSVQNEFNVLERRDVETVIPRAKALGLDYLAFSPLAGGLLTGKYASGTSEDSRLAVAPAFFERYRSAAVVAALDALRREAEAKGTAMTAAALRFILDTPGVGGLIIAPRKIKHFASYGLTSA